MARTDVGTLDGDLAAPNLGDRERLVLTLGGAILILNGLARPSTWHTLLALAGVELVRRGISGRGGLYRPRGAARRATMARIAAPEPYRSSFTDYVDCTLDESFPASDPPAWTVSSRVGRPAHMPGRQALTDDDGARG
jgi:hypothetical protein